MSFQSIPPERLFQVLNNTGIQNKDTPLYQLLFSMIAALQTLNINSGGSGGGGGGSTTVNNFNTVVQQILADSSADANEEFMMIPGSSSGGSGSGEFVPYFIALGEVFTVPEFKQALFSMNIDNEGIIVIDGFLIEVD